MAKQTNITKVHTAFKAAYPDAVILIRVGSFYETIQEDAEKVAQVLGTVLHNAKDETGQPVTLTGFPDHALDVYLHKLVRAGYRVAVAEQLEAPPNTAVQSTLF